MPQPSQKTARFVAIETLNRLERTRLPVDLLFEQIMEDCPLAAIDRHLAKNLIFGVLRQRQHLDRCLALFCTRPLKKLHPFVHQALAVGLYQILFLDRIPESAAVNETVQAVKLVGLPQKLQGFVNGVLRTSIRQREQIPSPTAPDSEGRPVLNHPSWLTDRWQQHFGREAMYTICDANNQPPPLVLRTNLRVTTRDELCRLLGSHGITTRKGALAPQAIVLPDYHGPISELPGFVGGAFQVQDESAQLAGLLVAPLPARGRILDACAGLGGKTGHLLERASGLDAAVYAVEPEPRRLALLQENLTRIHPQHRVTIIPGTLADFTAGNPGRFDTILVDAPCSGTGVIRRQPDIRWNRSDTELPTYARTQQELLTLAAGLLVPGGTLVYATCSLEPEENEAVITSFLRSHSSFEISDCTPFLPEAAKHLVHNGFFRPRPDQGTDGFFAARLLYTGT